MKTLTLAGGELKVSSFCLGCMPFGVRISGGDVDALFDAFREAGGNFFDTAHCYSFWQPCGDGASERALGDCIRRAGCRDEVVIATKGAHPPAPRYRQVEQYMSPGRIAADIDDSLARLQVDVIDLYWLHRDDPRLDTGAILDMLEAERRRGRVRFYGGSNWTGERLADAARYAEQHGLTGFVASQPRWSLLEYKPMTRAQRLEPGVLVHLNREDREWHARSHLPVIPYGPTGNGFFATGGAGPERFNSPENQARAARAAALARELDATPNQVALAWLMAQPFPVVPILGTSRIDHLQDALAAEHLALTPEQTAALEPAT